ncbi:MAG: ATP-binding protein [Alkalispirochaeta sp.]
MADTMIGENKNTPFVDQLEYYFLEGELPEGRGTATSLQEELAMRLADVRFLGDPELTETLEALSTLLQQESVPDPGVVLPHLMALRAVENEAEGNDSTTPGSDFVRFELPSEKGLGKLVGEEERLLLRNAQDRGRRLYYLEVHVDAQWRQNITDIIESEFAVIRLEWQDGNRSIVQALIVAESEPAVAQLLQESLPESCGPVETQAKLVPFDDLLQPQSVARGWYDRVPGVPVSTDFETVERTLVLLQEMEWSGTQEDDPVWSELSANVKRSLSSDLRTVFEQLQPAVRSIGEELEKRVVIRVSGNVTGVSTAYAATLREYIFELVVNAIRHGVELPAERIRKDKPEVGTVNVLIRQSGRRLTIRVRDDGRGVDQEAIRHAFTRQSEGGLSRLRHAIQEQFGGKLSLRTGDHGTTAEIDIPYGPGVYRAGVFRHNRESFAVPAALVISILSASESTLVQDASGATYIRVDGRAVPFLELTGTGEVSGHVEDLSFSGKAFVLSLGGREIALAADELIKEVQVIPEEGDPATLYVEGTEKRPVRVRLHDVFRKIGSFEQ